MGITRLNPSTCTLDTVGDSTMYYFTHAVSADGRYLLKTPGESLIVYSIERRRVERVVHIRATEVSCSPDGRLMAVERGEGYGLTILNLPGYDTRCEINMAKVGGSIFSHDSRTLYCLDGTPYLRQVLRIRVGPSLSIEAVPTPTMPGALIQVVPSVDEKLLFLYSRWHWDGCTFGVWDVTCDSLIYLSDLRPGAGWIAVDQRPP